MRKGKIIKISAKEERKRQVLFGLIAHYIKFGTPVASNTLKESEFQDLSSATIRNYFSSLEDEGFLTQLHSSGGRVPTPLAFRTYVDAFNDSPLLTDKDKNEINTLKRGEREKIALFLQKSAEKLAQISNGAAVLLAPRFDSDFVTDVKLVMLDVDTALSIVVTNFGVVETHVLHSPLPLNSFRVKRLESYFHYRLTKIDKPEALEEGEEELGREWYNEVLIRYVAGYHNFTDDEIYTTGLSNLLQYPEFEDIENLARTLSLFEEQKPLQMMLRESYRHAKPLTWIGPELKDYGCDLTSCSFIATPYSIAEKTVGAIGVVGPTNMDYRRIFGILNHLSETMKEVLTSSVHKYQMTYREPARSSLLLPKDEKLLLAHAETLLIEDHSRSLS